ncbi:sensor histidine kinase [Microbacterium sp. DT81.1]|uniref:sensor histidine kinase n=1 Tax=Microbacterium sp. DT81.1 TaxID=3393413 RepID=UPI003CED6298
MRLRRPSLPESVVAALCGLWVGLFLAAEISVAIPVALGAAGLTLVLPQRPVLAGAALALPQLGLAIMQVTNETAAALAPLILVVYTVGRHASLWPGIAVAAVFPVAALIEALDLTTFLFAIVVTGSVYAYGRVVRRRARAADAALLAASELQATDAAALTIRTIADERARLGGQSLAVLRDSIAAMRKDATAAEADLDPGSIESIAARGRHAVTELRWLLGLLRSAPVPDPPPDSPPDRRWVTDAVVAAALIGFGALEISFGEWVVPSPMVWGTAVGLPLCVAVRSRSTPTACGMAVILVGGALLAGIQPLAISIVPVALLAWSVGATSRPSAWAMFVPFALGTVAWSAAIAPGNAPFAAALVALPAFAGHEWSAYDRAGRVAAARAEKLRADINARIELARRDERLRIARELHDVTSHAVGVMVMQAAAAQALRQRDPAAARQALHVVLTTAEQASTELEMMFDLLESGAIGSPGLARASREPLPVLVQRLRGVGLDITLELPPVPTQFDDTVYRIVQESLTNIVRHSDAQNVRVTVTVDDHGVNVLVADDGRDTADRVGDTDGTRFGLAGLSERVQAAGGTLRAGRHSGGFSVEATLPSEPQVHS